MGTEHLWNNNLQGNAECSERNQLECQSVLHNSNMDYTGRHCEKPETNHQRYSTAGLASLL
jgi:hypothetical protein